MANAAHVRAVYEYLSRTVVPRMSPATYEEVCGVIGLRLDEAWNYIQNVLATLFEVCDEHRLPPLTSIVVGVHAINGRHGMPGSGYFVACAVSPNQSRRVQPQGIAMFHPDQGLSIDQKEALRADFAGMVHAHQDTVWRYGRWPDAL
jgi:hypothetical protein